MNTYFLQLLDYHQPRRIRVIENVLKNRRTVANLFWAKQYGILHWLGALRELTRPDYDGALKELAAAGLITIDNQYAQLTAKGVAFQEDHRSRGYQPHFFDWYWVANTRQLEGQLMIGIQVISEFAYHNRRYAPLAVSYRQLATAKQWFRREYSPRLAEDVYTDLHRLAQSLASDDQRLAVALAYILIGHQLDSWTLPQLAGEMQLTLPAARVLIHDLFLAVGAYCRQVPGPLQDLLRPLLMPGPLSASAQTSLQMMNQSLAFTEIARRRHLKENTVREHILEAAIVTPDQVDFDRLLPLNKRRQLAAKYPGTDTLNWKFNAAQTNSNKDFFEYRLYQLYVERKQND